MEGRSDLGRPFALGLWMRCLLGDVSANTSRSMAILCGWFQPMKPALAGASVCDIAPSHFLLAKRGLSRTAPSKEQRDVSPNLCPY